MKCKKCDIFRNKAKIEQIESASYSIKIVHSCHIVSYRLIDNNRRNTYWIQAGSIQLYNIRMVHT